MANGGVHQNSQGASGLLRWRESDSSGEFQRRLAAIGWLRPAVHPAFIFRWL